MWPWRPQGLHLRGVSVWRMVWWAARGPNPNAGTVLQKIATVGVFAPLAK